MSAVRVKRACSSTEVGSRVWPLADIASRMLRWHLDERQIFETTLNFVLSGFLVVDLSQHIDNRLRDRSSH
jgi:hypothetical protein